jgi:Flp pilus assembly protein TadG
MRIWNRRRGAPPGVDVCAAAAGNRDAGSREKGRHPAFATVEFALVSMLFFFMVFATVDFGRAIFIYSELHHGARDAAREMKVKTANGDTNGAISNTAIQRRVRYAWDINSNPSMVEYPRPGLQTATSSYSCTGGCVSGGKLNITASVNFTPVTLSFLQIIAPGLGPITLTTTTSVTLE